MEAQWLRGNGKQRDKREGDESTHFPEKHCSILCRRGFARKPATLKTSLNVYSFDKLLSDAIRGPAAKRIAQLPGAMRHRSVQVLGDDSRSPRYIKTFPKVGYQFIGPVIDRVSLCRTIFRFWDTEANSRITCLWTE